MKKSDVQKRYKVLVVSIIAVALALAAIAIYTANEDRFQNVTPYGHLEEGAEIKMSKKADLFGSGNEATIALINLPLLTQQDNTGYLGIWDKKGKLLQKFDVKGYDILHPVQIQVSDITGDNNPDIILETDAYANGGLGVHVLHVYVQEKGQYIEAPVPYGMNTSFTVTYDQSSNDFTMISDQDNRKWTVRWTADQLKELDSILLSQSNAVNIDSISSIDLQNNILKTKRLIWFGNVQLNSLAILVTSFHFEEGKWDMQSYSMESVDKMSIVTEQK
jgi:hypothetical protein